MERARGIIVIEGADAAGKTTLANYFREKYGARYIHSTVRKDIWRWHVGALDLACQYADHELVILDRHWPSELIYGYVFRGGPAYDLGARSLDRVLRKHGAMYVLCVPSDRRAQLKIHADRYAAGTEKFKNVERVAELYYELAYGNQFRGELPGYLGSLVRRNWFAKRDDVALYDYAKYPGDKGLRYFAGNVIALLQRVRESQFEHCLNYTTMNVSGRPSWDSTRTDTLFVGERVSPQIKPGQPSWPFVWHDGMSAVSYLNAALQSIDWDETRGVWTNAKTWYGDDDTRIRQILLTRRWRRIVALGSIALEAYRGNDQPLVHIPHPQYHRRFGFDPMSYAKIVDGAVNVREIA